MIRATARALRAATAGLAAAAALTVVWLALGAGTATARTHPLFTGITNLEESEPVAFQQTRATGARFIRIGLPWEHIAPAVPPSQWRPEDPADPNYSWSHIDQLVSRAVEAGLTPLLQIGTLPAWAQRCQAPPILPWASCDPDPAALSVFATAAARHFNGTVAGAPRVRYWQALNEPNLSIFFFPQYNTAGKPLSPSLYRALVNAFYAGVKSADRSNLVVAAGLGPIAVPPWTIGPLRFARELLCMRGHRKPVPVGGNCGGGVHFDIFAIHPYTTGGPAHEGGVNDVELGDLGKLQTLLAAADRAGRIQGRFGRTPIWVTEFSWDSKPPDPGGLPMRIETRWIAEALHQSWRHGVTHFFWYSLRDDARENPAQPFSQTLESGLYFRGPTVAEDQPKEALGAFRFPFVAYPGDAGLSFWGRTPTSQAGRVAIQLWKGGQWRTHAAVYADKVGIFRGIFPRSAYGQNKTGLVRAVYGGQPSVPFSMRPVKDFRQSPFG